MRGVRRAAGGSWGRDARPWDSRGSGSDLATFGLLCSSSGPRLLALRGPCPCSSCPVWRYLLSIWVEVPPKLQYHPLPVAGTPGNRLGSQAFPFSPCPSPLPPPFTLTHPLLAFLSVHNDPNLFSFWLSGRPWTETWASRG
jgi:hypothetical protein